jgi:hypothetical protein
MNEIIFLVEEAVEGGYTARALGSPSFTEADSLDELHTNVRDAVQCHYDEGKALRVLPMSPVATQFIRYQVLRCQ